MPQICLACQQRPAGLKYHETLFCQDCIDATKARAFDDDEISTLTESFEDENDPSRPTVYRELTDQPSAQHSILAALRLAYRLGDGLRLLELIALAETKLPKEKPTL